MKVFLKALTTISNKRPLFSEIEQLCERSYKDERPLPTYCISLFIWDRDQGLMYPYLSYWKDTHPRWKILEIRPTVERLLRRKEISFRYCKKRVWEVKFCDEELLTNSNEGIRKYAVRRLGL